MHEEINTKKERKISVKFKRSAARIAVTSMVAVGFGGHADRAIAQGNQSGGATPVTTTESGGVRAPEAQAHHKHSRKQEQAAEHKLIRHINAVYSRAVQDGEGANAWLADVVKTDHTKEHPKDGVTFPGMAQVTTIENPFVYANQNPQNFETAKIYVGTLTQEDARVHFRPLRANEQIIMKDVPQPSQEVVYPQSTDGYRDFNEGFGLLDDYGNTLDQPRPLVDAAGVPYQFGVAEAA